MEGDAYISISPIILIHHNLIHRWIFYFIFLLPFLLFDFHYSEQSFIIIWIYFRCREILLYLTVLTWKLIEFYDKISWKIKNALGRILMENCVKLANDVKFRSLWISIGK